MKNKQDKEKLDEERSKILSLWDEWFEIPLIILGFCWLVLIVIELSAGLTPLLENLSFTIWIVFILDFIVRFSIAPFKINYLKSQWITLIALIVPAFRVFRGFRFLRATRSIYLVKVVASVRRGMQILGSVLGRHGFGYIMGLTFIIILLGAAGIQALEGAFVNYGEALWWTTMMITTMGTDYWPQTAEGRILCLGLAIYAFAIFGYITATVASFLIEKDKKNQGDYQKLLDTLEEIKIEIQSLKSGMH
ncbi:MAG: ion transporter [Parachlamydiaceae bacterium]|nr:ion transporter [Parachlamydiaceae bacterium]